MNAMSNKLMKDDVKIQQKRYTVAVPIIRIFDELEEELPEVENESQTNSKTDKGKIVNEDTEFYIYIKLSLLYIFILW